MQKRREAILEATPGGSVPATYMEELRTVSRASSALRLEVDEGIERSRVSVDDDGEHLVVDGERFGMAILATGVMSTPSCSPLYQSIADLFDAPTVGGLPRVDSRLRWMPGEDLFVLGANAVPSPSPSPSL